MTPQPQVKKGDWIVVGYPHSQSPQNGLVIDVYRNGTLGVGYHQNKFKAIKSDVIWNGEYWKFKTPGPDGTYLSGQEEHTVTQGPPRRP